MSRHHPIPDFITKPELVSLSNFYSSILNDAYHKSIPTTSTDNKIRAAKSLLGDLNGSRYLSQIISIPVASRPAAYAEIKDFILSNPAKFKKLVSAPAPQPLDILLQIEIFSMLNSRDNKTHFKIDIVSLISAFNCVAERWSYSSGAILSKIDAELFDLDFLNTFPKRAIYGHHENIVFNNLKNLSYLLSPGYPDNLFGRSLKNMCEISLFRSYLSGHASSPRHWKLIRSFSTKLIAFGANPLFSQNFNYKYLLLIESLGLVPSPITNYKKNNFLQHKIYHLLKNLHHGHYSYLTLGKEIISSLNIVIHCFNKYRELFNNINHYGKTVMDLLVKYKIDFAEAVRLRRISISDDEKKIINNLFAQIEIIKTYDSINKNIYPPSNNNKIQKV